MYILYKIIMFTGDCGENHQEQCEEKMDMFLNNYCERVSLNTTLLAAHTLEPNQTSLHVLTPNIKNCTLNPSQSESRFEAIVALGCVLGLCVILLLVMTIGWVYTCRALKTLQRYIQRPVKNSLELR